MADEGPKLKVFISYSWAGLAFADELVAGLEYDGGFEVTIDRHSIVEGEGAARRAHCQRRPSCFYSFPCECEI
jgi:hypothetical protein